MYLQAPVCKGFLFLSTHSRCLRYMLWWFFLRRHELCSRQEWYGLIYWYWIYEFRKALVNTLKPRQNGRHFADDIFKRIFLKENVSISIKISKGSTNNILSLVHIMAWRQLGTKPLFEPMMVYFTDAYIRHLASMRKQGCGKEWYPFLHYHSHNLQWNIPWFPK